MTDTAPTKYHCKAILQTGPSKGTECSKLCDESNYCERHKKYRTTDDIPVIICRKSKTHGCKNIVPAELLERNIKTCMHHYRLQTKTRGEVCVHEGCKNPKKTINGYCLVHDAYETAKKIAEKTHLVFCNTKTCNNIIDPDVGFKRCERCRVMASQQKKHERLKTKSGGEP